MLKAILLSGILTISTLFAGCATTAQLPDARSTHAPVEELERQQVCAAIEEYAHLSAQLGEEQAHLLGASNLKYKYKVEACKKVLFKSKGYGIVSFKIYQDENNLPSVEDEVMVMVALDNGKWVVVQAQLLYSSASPGLEQENNEKQPLSVQK